jgi:hypothetical protein
MVSDNQSGRLDRLLYPTIREWVAATKTSCGSFGFARSDEALGSMIERTA